jgi:hypothetical protein
MRAPSHNNFNSLHGLPAGIMRRVEFTWTGRSVILQQAMRLSAYVNHRTVCAFVDVVSGPRWDNDVPSFANARANGAALGGCGNPWRVRQSLEGAAIPGGSGIGSRFHRPRDRRRRTGAVGGGRRARGPRHSLALWSGRVVTFLPFYRCRYVLIVLNEVITGRGGSDQRWPANPAAGAKLKLGSLLEGVSSWALPEKFAE